MDKVKHVSLFRQECVEHRANAFAEVRVSPSFSPVIYVAVLAISALLLATLLFKVPIRSIEHTFTQLVTKTQTEVISNSTKYVSRILVQPGQLVTEGQGLFVLKDPESSQESVLNAPYSGKQSSVLISERQLVRKGDVLAILTATTKPENLVFSVPCHLTGHLQQGAPVSLTNGNHIYTASSLSYTAGKGSNCELVTSVPNLNSNAPTVEQTFELTVKSEQKNLFQWLSRR